MKILLLTLTGLLSFGAIASCELPDGSRIPEGKMGEYSLFQRGKVFEKQTVIDQDGLGTCYAVTPATTLKTILPGNPDISYHHAAMVGSEKVVKGKLSRYDRIGEEKRLFIEGGFVCQTIDAMKKKGGYCPKEFSRLENHPLEDPKFQAFAHLGLAKYFDKVNGFLATDEARVAELKSGIEEALKIIAANKESKYTCSDNYFPVNEAVKDFMLGTLFDDHAHPCRKRLEAIQKMNDEKATFDIFNEYQLRPKKQVLDEFQKFFREDPALAAKFNEFMKAKGKPDAAIVKALEAKVAVLLNELVPREQLDKCQRILDDGSHPLITLGASQMAVNFLEKMRGERSKHCRNRTELDSAKAQATDECAHPEIQAILGAVHPLLELGEKADADGLFDLLMNPVTKEARQISRILMPECETNLKPLDKVTCRDVNMCSVPKLMGFNGGEFSGKPGTCHDLPRAKRIFASHAVRALRKNQSLSISVCTGFFSKSGTKTRYCKNKPGTGKHRYHSIVVSGIRCNSGRVEYELLNSWGKHCPENPNLDCVKEKDGKTNAGRFWVKADELVDSTMTIHDIQRDDD